MAKVFERIILASGFLGTLAMPATPTFAQDATHSATQQTTASSQTAASVQHGMEIRVQSSGMDISIQACPCWPFCASNARLVVGSKG